MSVLNHSDEKLEMNETRFDVVIVGGGLVGASLALALAGSRQKVALVEGGMPTDPAALLQGWDSRIYAISPANRRFLESLGAWPDSARIGIIREMDVRGDAGGAIRFSAEDADAQVLAYIAENRWMLGALWQRLAESGIHCMTGARVAELATDPHRAWLTMDDGRQFEARLVVGADGAASRIRTLAGVDAAIKPYGQSGVVANFACERPHGGVARQWFTGDSILAWLPMAGNRISIVWSTFRPEDLLALDEARLADTVAAAGQHALGRLETLTPAAAFPLRLIRPEGMVRERVALAGDAAHTVHPLAGQGVNLGFQDAAVLAGLLREAADAGDWMLLRRYERSRREAIHTMQTACDGLFSLFHTHDLPGLAWLRNTGLTLAGRLGPLRRQFARHAIGY